MTERQAVDKMLSAVDFLTLKQQHALQVALTHAPDEDVKAIGKFLSAYLRAETDELAARQL